MKLSRTVTGILAVALISFMVSDAMGQRPGGQGGQGGRGGQGGQGGRGGQGGGPGFSGRGGGGSDALGLLRIEEVRTEIELMPDQEEAIKKLSERPQDRERTNFDFRNASEEERREFFEKMQKEREERAAKMREELEVVLLPQQLERLDQISIQIRGLAALRDKKVIEAIKITSAQQKELEEVQSKIQTEMRDKMRELFHSGDRDSMREAFGKLREESEKKVLGVLTTQQQKDFEKMKGEPFEMPESSRFGGRGGRGGQGGGPGGGAGGRGGRGGQGGGPGGQGGRGGRGARPAAEEEA